jgi:membrane protein involved in colicin uptake
MTAAIALLLKFGPWLLTAGAALFALITHLKAKATTADVKQKATVDVAAAQAQQNVAEQNLADRKAAESEANAQAAQAAADAAKERGNVENAQSVLTDDAARDSLLGLLHGTGSDNPAAGQGSPGDQNS